MSSELWKWANYMTMSYSEEECDYLVEYLDYVQRDHWHFPKKWFVDGYSALYEGFMQRYHRVLGEYKEGG